MNLAKERKAIDAALDEYRARLDAIPDELFTETPPGGGWSYAEVYSHIIKGTLGSTIVAERCAQGNTPPTTKGPTLLGRYMLLTGSLPPLKLKVTAEVAAKMPAEEISKEEAKNSLVKCRKRVETIMPLIKDAPPHSRSGNPRMGMLNAAQWLRFMRAHLYHHLKQLSRIEKKFRPM
ncbi:DinB family protein [Mucilaginibacter sp. L3T2-6]|uniref:DinB family protein n=1 Tax=Mucilaginibacter sp. L3T2-6 TaxID=3062491 RepID=UPI00267713D3|nr:DinB family protein [Mucilaginibacter sp. L3T2-6]MDO3640684.1 DinB family protein [Mucilaginibacter sp. L3T2-6]MDV6212976.1 DinB family protein [Mucilaginibacter sp. L3T2-6]